MPGTKLLGVNLKFPLIYSLWGFSFIFIHSAVANSGPLLKKYCYDCHDRDVQKGGIRLDNFSHLKLDGRLALLNKIQEQLYSGQMPPKKKKQPTDSERDFLLEVVSNVLKKHQSSSLEDKLRFYRYGNYTDHDKLFSGKIKEQPYSPARRWLINEFIYNERINEVFRLKGRERQRKFYGVVKTFNLPSEAGVKYYDNNMVESGQYMTLLANAEWIVDKQLRAALIKSGEFKYPEEFHKTPRRAMIYKFPGEIWNLKTTEAEFEKIIFTKGEPTDSDLKKAINHQFEGALQRQASQSEMARYLKFVKDAIKIGGNSAGLRKMMVAVLMEPDFIYRSELGNGKEDSYERMMLTPREASFSIAYALTDKVPDPHLVKAAQSNRLASRQDYEREIRRILDDGNIAKPRILRFFQDYFGYYNIFNVFKDEERFGGAYNPHRVVAAKFIHRIPGKLTEEADLLIKHILEKDKNVLEELLTTEKFYVHHNGDNKAMHEAAKQAQIVDRKNRQAYAVLKDVPNNKKEEVARANKLFSDNKGGVNTRLMGRRLKEWKKVYGQFNIQNAKPMPADGESVGHSVKMYNLDPWTWEYEPEQPMKIDHRMGILTHPAWLVSFSQNDHTDPVLRGKWVREKLLAGFVPDLPINVDATIPEDPHKTLRDRFSVVENKQCWTCHEKMNPLGNIFESFDDFGRYRTEESLEHEQNILRYENHLASGVHGPLKVFKMPIYKTAKVDASGHLDGTDDATLDGKIKDFRDLMKRLAKSDRVRQSFIRHVFRYFMGRNERLTDSQTLIAAEKAYLDNKGSFKEMMVSLLTSDSFIFRKNSKE